jgi:pyrroline-5-carboxylate reductase
MPVNTITIIGVGNVGSALAMALHAAGFQIRQLFTRHPERIQDILDQTGAAYTDRFEEIDNRSDLYIASIKDDALAELAEALRLGNQLIVHTAGAVPGLMA